MRLIFLFLFSWLLTLNSLAFSENILFIVSDDLQACLGPYKHSVCKTPNLDRLANEGVTFNKAYCQFPICAPSRASFMSGLYPQTMNILGNTYKSYKKTNPKLANHPNLGELFKNNGYYTARVSKIFHGGIPGEIERGHANADMRESWDWYYNPMPPELYSPGDAKNLSPKNRHFGSNFYRVIVPNHLEATQADAMAVTQAIAVLENRQAPLIPKATNKQKLKANSPFFLAVGLIRPHVPLVAPKKYFDLYPLDSLKLFDNPEEHLQGLPMQLKRSANRFKMTKQEMLETLQAYYATVSYMDEQVGRLLNTLDRIKIREKTTVIFISDHGYNLGEHEAWGKPAFWEDCTKVPMIISDSRYKKNNGKRSDALVELIDLYPTLADLNGILVPKLCQGYSLKPLLENPEANWPRKAAYTVISKNKSIRTHRYRYSQIGRDRVLYDLEKDPGEFRNLAGHPEYQEIQKKLETQLQEKHEKAKF